ncbi:MAG: Rieske 2Fe-2S domain-containing protein [Candidatus Binatia bacterium]
MMPQEENQLLTQVGRGKPAGELLMGEDLVLFRDDQGRAGLLGIHCSHRGTDLSYGRVEDGGLRCLYHGWLYDIQGHCLEQPGEPGGEHRGAIRHLAYPCQEAGGVIFVYMGTGGSSVASQL